MKIFQKWQRYLHPHAWQAGFGGIFKPLHVSSLMNSKEKCLLIMLALLFFAMCLSLSFTKQVSSLPQFYWNPGYWQIYPGMGMTRIIPIAGPVLASPAAGAGGREVRQSASH